MSFPNGETTQVLEGFSNAEITMIRRLAGNDPEIRKKTIRKLRKWLMVIAKRIPDSPEARKLCEPNFIRVWKALFYCMWMADKPVPQETLAEQISNLISIFTEKPQVMLIFIEWFFITMAREWPWIDRLRMDKFKMLVRRFIRKTLEQLSNQDWDSDLLDSFNNVIHIHLFNHHSPPPKTRTKQPRLPDPIKSPLGLQIHVVDIFLEELAKVGGEGISSEIILKSLEPFISELCNNDDQRLLDEVKQRIFHHLMKQSDVGIEFEESKGGKYVRMELDDDEEEGGDENEVEIIESIKNGPLDPRAGQVDVVLPQLQLNYEDLIRSLNEAALTKTTKMKNRKMLFILAREFQRLVKGEYPLGIPYVNDSRVPAIPRKEVQKAAERLLEFEENLIEPKDKKKKKKKKKNMNAVAHEVEQGTNDSIDSIHSEDNSMYLNDSDLMDHLGDNYQSYLAEMGPDSHDSMDDQDVLVVEHVEPIKKRTKKSEMNGNVEVLDADSKKTKLKRKSLQLETTAQMNGVDQDVKAKKLKRKSLPLQPLESGVGNDNIEEAEMPKKTKRKSISVPVQKNNSEFEFTSASASASANIKKRKSLPAKLEDSSKDTYITIKKRNLSKPIDAVPSPITTLKLKENATTGSPLKLTPIKLSNLKKQATPITPGSGSGLKKKVNFVLAKNLEHPHHDYPLSIQRSPAIPYDSEKKPRFGLLKSPAGRLSLPIKSSGMSSPRRKVSPIPRRKAAEFF